MLLLFQTMPSVFAIPAYLTPDSLFPTAHYRLEFLERRTDMTFEQRWFQVRIEKQQGWVSAQNLVRAMQLSQTLRCKKLCTYYTDPSLSAGVGGSLAAGLLVNPTTSVNDWYGFVPAGQTQVFYLRGSDLESQDLTLGKAWLKEDVPVRLNPQAKSQEVFRARAREILSVVQVAPTWLKLASAKGVGFVPRTSAIARFDFAANAAAVVANVPLRSAPTPAAEVLRLLPKGTVVQILRSDSLKWARAVLPKRKNPLWWPARSSRFDSNRTPVVTLNSNEIFQRKIFDMASSPAQQGLQIVSAGGVFRTTDGHKWMQLPTFANSNYPLAFSGAGVLFVGPYISFDHGESFSDYIRWENLVDVLRGKFPHSTPRVRIVSIEPLDAQGERLKLQLDLGGTETSWVYSTDQGQNWFVSP